MKGTYIDILLGLAMNGSDNKSRIERYYMLILDHAILVCLLNGSIGHT